MDKIKYTLKTMHDRINQLMETLDKVLQSSKYSSLMVGKIRLFIDGIEHEGIKIMYKLI